MGRLLTDYIKLIDSAISSQMCDELIRRFEASPSVFEGKVGTEEGAHIPNFRSCLELNVTKCEEFSDLHPYLEHTLQNTVQVYRENVDGCMFPERYAYEHMRMKKYRSGKEFQDQFRDHVDVDSHQSAKRFLACFYYLTDVEKGGETRFPHLNINIKPVKGRAVVFPPMWLYVHSGEVPISNDKYLLGSYLNYL